MTFPKPPPRFRQKADKRKADEALRREIYRLVDIRDDRHCRACGRRCRTTMEAVADRLEHHHLKFLSLGGKHETHSIIVTCLECHVEMQQHRIAVTGSADAVLTFENTVTGQVWHG